MYKIIISTTEGQIIKTINNFNKLQNVLAPYQKTYIGVQAVYEPGDAPVEEEKPVAKKYNTEVKITNFNVNWKNIKAACMTTISKDAGDKEPSHEWKKKLLLAEHSPIRRGVISWK